MHPILFEIHGFEVGTYALFAMLGLAMLASVFAWLGAREGREPVRLVELILWAFIVGLIASKAFSVLLNVNTADPWPGMKESLRYGGHYLVGFFAGSAFLLGSFRRARIPIAHGLDLVVPGLALGHAIGRIGCFFAGCCWGEACTAPW